MPQAATPLSTQSPQGLAPAPTSPANPAPAASSAPVAPPPTPVQILWDVATLAFGLLARIHSVLQPVQARFPKQAWQVARLFIDLPRIFLTIRYAPERVTPAQLRHLTRARQILQALFGYSLPTLGAPISRLASAPTSAKAPASSLDPSAATPPGARTPATATPAVRQVPAVPEVPGVSEVSTPGTPSSASAHAPDSSPGNPQSAIGNQQSAISDNHASHNPQSAIYNPQSSFSPHIPDYQTLFQALKADSLPASCAGALVDDPGDALVKALQQLHAIYFSLYPNQSSTQSHSHSHSHSQSQSVQSVQSVHAVHSEFSNPVSPSSQSEISNFKSEILNSPTPSNPQSAIYNPQSDIPHSTAPP